MALLVLFFSFYDQHVAFEALAGGINSNTRFVSYDGKSVHCKEINLDSCVRAASSASGVKRVLFIGASQFHTLASYEEGQKTLPWYLHKNLLKNHVFSTAVSLPNGNFQEFKLVIDDLFRRRDWDAVVIAAVLDDMREYGIRQTVLDLSNKKVAVASQSSQTEKEKGVARQVLEDSSFWLAPRAPVEAWLTSFMEKTSLWRLREQVRGSLITSLFYLKNKLKYTAPVFVEHLFGSKLGQRLKKLLSLLPQRLNEEVQDDWFFEFNEATWQGNAKSLDQIVHFLKRKNVPLLIYLQPHPGDVPFPYKVSDQERFSAFLNHYEKKDENSAKGGLRVLDLQTSIPDDVWGYIDRNHLLVKDIFHMKEAGHRAFADRLSVDVDAFLKDQGVLP